MMILWKLEVKEIEAGCERPVRTTSLSKNEHNR
jgi:hypothetical protein